MTNSESQFRVWFKKLNPSAYIHKIPDFKATRSSAGAGLPDYVTVSNGNTMWYEVKTVPGKTLSLSHFTPAQRRVFPLMLRAGAEIIVWVKLKRGHFSCFYDTLLKEKKLKLLTK